MHHYAVDVSGCTSGSQVVDAIMNYIAANPARTTCDATDLAAIGLPVSHSNILMKSADGNSLIVAAASGRSTEEAAKVAYKNATPYGKVDCSGLTKVVYPEPVLSFRIKCSANEGDAESLIRDTNMAKEMVHYSMQDILSQAGLSMMAQANQSNSGGLKLLEG